jgi:hypothetical protein
MSIRNIFIQKERPSPYYCPSTGLKNNSSFFINIKFGIIVILSEHSESKDKTKLPDPLLDAGGDQKK